MAAGRMSVVAVKLGALLCLDCLFSSLGVALERCVDSK